MRWSLIKKKNLKSKSAGMRRAEQPERYYESLLNKPLSSPIILENSAVYSV